MKAQIKIKTPKGEAALTSKKIKPFIIGLKTKHKTRTNKEDNEIIWEVDEEPRKISAITKNVARYDVLINKMFTNKLLQKQIEKRISDEDVKTLKDMLKNQTSIEIIKK